MSWKWILSQSSFQIKEVLLKAMGPDITYWIQEEVRQSKHWAREPHHLEVGREEDPVKENEKEQPVK